MTQTNTIEKWFRKEMEPRLSTDASQPSCLHDLLLYALYIHAITYMSPDESQEPVDNIDDTPSYNEFQTHIHRVFMRRGWVPRKIGTPDMKNETVKRTIIQNVNDLNFDIENYCKKYINAQPIQLGSLLHHNVPGWYHLTECWLGVNDNQQEVFEH